MTSANRIHSEAPLSHRAFSNQMRLLLSTVSQPLILLQQQVAEQSLPEEFQWKKLLSNTKIMENII